MNTRLKKAFELHKKWLEGKPGGQQFCYDDYRDIEITNEFAGEDLRNANLSNAYLPDANLNSVNLSNANLSGAYLENANLSHANLTGVKLSDADLSVANLIEACLNYADLSNANLRGADLKFSDLLYVNLDNADLRQANLMEACLINARHLDTVRYDEGTSFFALQCPEMGSYRAFKKAGDKIIELEITEDALRSSATSRKCRASKAKILAITELDGIPSEVDNIKSDHDENFIYKVGEIVEVKNFDTNRWKECSTGIHHFLTRQEAVKFKIF